MTAVRHGYTLADIHNLAIGSAKANLGMASDYSDLYEAAWFSIVEALLIVSHWPTRHDLYTAGRKGIWEIARSTRSTYGYLRDDYTSELACAPRFAKYWTPGAPGDFTDAITDRIAARQVMGALKPHDQQILQTVAATSDYAIAAQLLETSTRSVHDRAATARRRWLELWHENETPHIPARRHIFRRASETSGHTLAECGTAGAYRRHLKRGEPIDPECRQAYQEHERARGERRRAVRKAST